MTKIVSVWIVVLLIGLGMSGVSAQAPAKEPVEKPNPTLTELQTVKATLMKVEMASIEDKKTISAMATAIANCQQQQLTGVMETFGLELAKQLGASDGQKFDYNTMGLAAKPAAPAK